MDGFLDALVDICGPDHARAGRATDTVGGRRVPWVAVPATARAAADVLGLAAGRGLTALARGSGSKLDWGAPRADPGLLVDTARLNGLWSYGPDASTVEVATGTPVRALQAALALRGRRLPVDPPAVTATVGGMLAVNESGPLRHAYGPPAAFVERVTYADVSGVVAESDGEDGRPGLGEIDGVITSAVIRLSPVPAARCWVRVPLPNPLQITKLTAVAEESEPVAVEADLPADGMSDTMAALFESAPGEPDATARARRLADAWGADAVVTPGPPGWWGRYPFGRDDVALRFSVPAADLPAVLYTLGDATGGPVPARGSAALGSVLAVLPGTLDVDRVERIMDSLRHVLMARDGNVSVVAAPEELRTRIDMAARYDLF